MSHSLGQKKKKKANNKISISQFNMSPCQNIFYLATDTFWFLKWVFNFDFT